MEKRFNKKIDTPEAIAIYNELKNTEDLLKKAETERTAKFKEYWDMEGMLGKKAFSPWDQGQGLRGYHYEYSSEEIRLEEKEKMEEFYNQYVQPLKDKIDELYKVKEEQEEKLCIALWGFGTELFYAKKHLTSAEKHLSKMLAEVESQKKYIEKCKKEVEEIEKRS